jgi:hypothetical protein
MGSAGWVPQVEFKAERVAMPFDYLRDAVFAYVSLRLFIRRSLSKTAHIYKLIVTGSPANQARNTRSTLDRLLPVILMIVKEASNLSLQRGSFLQITQSAGALEELALELRGNGIPLHEQGCAQALQDLLLLVSEGGTIVAILSPLNCPIDMDRHPFFVFSKRRVGSLEIAELLRFVR